MKPSYYKNSGGRWPWNLKAMLCLLVILAFTSLLLTSANFFHVQAQRRAEGTSTMAAPSRANIERTQAILPIKILFKWSGIIGPGGGGGGCNTPLGICITRGFSVANSPLRREEIAEGYGIALSRVTENRLYLVFNREAALRDGTIRISRDMPLEPEVSRGLGYERITLKAGTYKVDMSVKPFGEAWMNIEKSSPRPVTPSSVVTCYTYQNTTGYGSGCGVACDDKTNYPMSCSADIFKASNKN
jgi:hypothetical protein